MTYSLLMDDVIIADFMFDLQNAVYLILQYFYITVYFSASFKLRLQPTLQHMKTTYFFVFVGRGHKEPFLKKHFCVGVLYI